MDVDKYKEYIHRYENAAHAMQSGVAMEMGDLDDKSTDPKHLRVGVNSAMVETATLVKLLIDKGVFTVDEHLIELTEQMEAEAKRYQERI